MLLLPLKSEKRPSALAAWRLLLRVAALIVGIRIGLELFPFNRVSGFVDRASRPARMSKPLTDEEKQRIIWAVRSLSKRILRHKPCLTQALVLKWLLLQKGEATEVHIGVRRDEEGDFTAHAWLEQEGNVIIGGKWAPTRYARLNRVAEEV